MPVRAFVFPGQGSQAVGMGKDLAGAFPAARELFEEVDEALKHKLSAIMFEGPQETLTLTENAQPALMAASMAVIRVLERDGGMEVGRAAALVAGHSLGEYTALAAAGCFELSDAARLLRLRGQAMQQAVPAGVGAMAALLGAEMDLARTIAEEAASAPDGNTQVCEAANDNGGGQVVLSGHKEAVERAIKIAAEKGVKRAMPLPVSAPFHCALMAPAADAMAEALAKVAIRTPIVPVIANVTAARETDPAEIRALLVRQVTSTVRWRECVLAMRAAGVDTQVEIGAGKVLTGLLKRIDREMAGVSVQGPAEIEAFLKTL